MTKQNTSQAGGHTAPQMPRPVASLPEAQAFLPNVDELTLGREILNNKLIPRQRMNFYFGIPWADMTYWRKERDGSFVKPVRIAGKVFYRYGDVMAWIEAQNSAS